MKSSTSAYLKFKFKWPFVFLLIWQPCPNHSFTRRPGACMLGRETGAPVSLWSPAAHLPAGSLRLPSPRTGQPSWMGFLSRRLRAVSPPRDPQLVHGTRYLCFTAFEAEQSWPSAALTSRTPFSNRLQIQRTLPQKPFSLPGAQEEAHVSPPPQKGPGGWEHRTSANPPHRNPPDLLFIGGK